MDNPNATPPFSDGQAQKVREARPSLIGTQAVQVNLALQRPVARPQFTQDVRADTRSAVAQGIVGF